MIYPYALHSSEFITICVLVYIEGVFFTLNQKILWFFCVLRVATTCLYIVLARECEVVWKYLHIIV